MSLLSWKEEFYPIPPSDDFTVREAIEHSLRKWRGLTKNNLDKHKLYVDEGDLFELDVIDNQDFFVVDSSTCALCFLFHDDSVNDLVEACVACPLAQELDRRCDFNCDSPWCIWTTCNDPMPMIRALEALLASHEE